MAAYQAAGGLLRSPEEMNIGQSERRPARLPAVCSGRRRSLFSIYFDFSLYFRELSFRDVFKMKIIPILGILNIKTNPRTLITFMFCYFGILLNLMVN